MRAPLALALVSLAHSFSAPRCQSVRTSRLSESVSTGRRSESASTGRSEVSPLLLSVLCAAPQVLTSALLRSEDMGFRESAYRPWRGGQHFRAFPFSLAFARADADSESFCCSICRDLRGARSARLSRFFCLPHRLTRFLSCVAHLRAAALRCAFAEGGPNLRREESDEKGTAAAAAPEPAPLPPPPHAPETPGGQLSSFLRAGALLLWSA